MTNDVALTDDEPRHVSGDDVSSSLAVSLARAEVDQQIATARALPRNVRAAVTRIQSLATLDQETAEACVYALPRGKGKPITGPSIRLAEVVANQYGNCRIGSRVTHVDRFEKVVIAEGMFHDLETNVATLQSVRRRISDKHGRLYNDDMITMTGNAAAAIAKRNAILGGVPRAIWGRTYDAVERVLAGDVKTLVARREAAVKAFAVFGVTPERVFASLEVEGIEDITLEHMPILTGMRSALKSGESTVEEMFPAKSAASPARTLDEQLDALSAPAAPPHDPETGEIEPARPNGAGPAAPAADASARPPLRTPLLDDLMTTGWAKAAEGSAALTAWLDEDLTGEELALITPHAKQLKSAAAKADKAGGKGNEQT